MEKNIKTASVFYIKAREFEAQKCYLEAAEQYLAALKIDPLHIDARNRLMIVYRKMKAYRKEIAVIRKAIAAHEKHIESGQRAWIKAHQKMAEQTRSLAQSLGLLTSKGLPVYENEMLVKWKRRQKILQGKLKKKK